MYLNQLTQVQFHQAMIHKTHHQINKIQVKVILQHIKHQHLVTTMAGILLLKVEVVAVDLVAEQALQLIQILLLQMMEMPTMIPAILAMLVTMFLNNLLQLQKNKNKQVINLSKYKSITCFLLCEFLSYPTTSIITLPLAWPVAT